MEASQPDDVRAVAAAFALPGTVVAAAPGGSGHINETFFVETRAGGRHDRFVLQRINDAIFRDPDAVMRNIELVVGHVRGKLEAAGRAAARRRCLTLVPTKAGRAWHVAADGGRWRCYEFLEGTVSLDVAETPSQAREAARGFGTFQAVLADLPGERLAETIPRFHDTASRFADFEAALACDAHGRAAEAAREIDFALARSADTGLVVAALARGELPLRVTHNDTKLGNVLLDASTHEALCVIDLDTVMPGSALYDFGDLVRTVVSPAPEDAPDTARVGVRMPMFEALLAGFLAGTGGCLVPRERELLPFAGKLITFEMGLRFLADWLDGDVYYRVARPRHNLDRARTQFALVADMERRMPEMESLVQ